VAHTQAIVMTRQAVDASTPGHAMFQVLDGMPLIAAGAGPTMGINQIDNALLGNRLLLDDLPLCLAEVLLIPYHRSELTHVPRPFGVPAVGRTAVMATSNCVPGPNFGCLWRNLGINLVELDLDVHDLPAWMDGVFVCVCVRQLEATASGVALELRDETIHTLVPPSQMCAALWPPPCLHACLLSSDSQCALGKACGAGDLDCGMKGPIMMHT
jgi:hypothetical protein